MSVSLLNTYAAIRQAIVARNQIVCVYNGYSGSAALMPLAPLTASSELGLPIRGSRLTRLATRGRMAVHGYTKHGAGQSSIRHLV